METRDERPVGRGWASSPEATPDELLDLAEEHPAEVLANPALPLLAREEPATYGLILSVARRWRAEKVIAAGLLPLPDGDHRLFACECVERVLWVYERFGPTPDVRLLRTLQVARRYARGEATEGEPRDTRPRPRRDVRG
jgi:hypothetical protein